MNTQTETDIRNRARRAYERSRAGNALGLAALVALPALTISLGCCPTPTASALFGLGLGTTIAAARFVGLRFQAALRPGLIAGLLAFAFPLVCRVLLCPSGMCMPGGMEWIPLVAGAAAFLGGIAMRFFLRGGSPLVAGATALLFGSLGSLAAGLEGPLWTVAGLAAGSFFPPKAMGRRGPA